jgi:hypothetical protein
MSDEHKGFTVKDRRMFTSEGELRADEAAEDNDAPRPPQAAPRMPSPSPEAESPRLRSDEVTLATFLMSLAAQAGALLEAGSAAELEGARQIVGILEMLQDKTEGRRSPDEDKILEGLLYELRLAYVERARMARA